MGYDLASFVSKTAELNAKITALREEYKAEAQKAFAEVTAGFFEEVPEVNALYWTQYTPYFNDGDECTFSVHDIYNHVAIDDEDSQFDEDGSGIVTWTDKHDDVALVEKYGKAKLDELRPKVKAVEKFISSLDNEVMRDMFGDHVQVIVTRDGVRVDEYEHD